MHTKNDEIDLSWQISARVQHVTILDRIQKAIFL